MKIVEALKKRGTYLRVSNINRWLVFNDDIFIVYEHKRYAKKTTIIIETSDEDKAVEALMNE